MLWCCRQLPKVDLARWQIACNESSNRQVNSEQHTESLTGFKPEAIEQRKQIPHHTKRLDGQTIFRERQIYDV